MPGKVNLFEGRHNELSSGLAESSEEARRVMTEAQGPIPGQGLPINPLLVLLGLNGIEVEAHDRGEADMSGGRNEVAQEEEGLASGRDLQALVKSRMTGNENGLRPLRDTRVPLDEI